MNYGFREAYFEYFESCNFSCENTNIDVSVFMVDLRMINMSSECEYDWYWKISACSTEYEDCDSFASLTRQETSYSGSAGWYFRYQSIHIQITYTYLSLTCSTSMFFIVTPASSTNKTDMTELLGAQFVDESS
jgi:hypothetical protein